MIRSDPIRGAVRPVALDKMRRVPLPPIYLVAPARTPIGRYGGGLRSLHAAELGAVAGRASLARAGLPPDALDLVVIGHARQAGSGPNPGRQVGRRIGAPDRWLRIFQNRFDRVCESRNVSSLDVRCRRI